MNGTTRLLPGQFFGTRVRSRVVAGAQFAESIYPPGFVIPVHSHTTPYLGLVLQGSYVETYERRTRTCRAATLLVHPADETHAERHDDVIVRILSIGFPAAWVDRVPEITRALGEPRAFDRGRAAAIGTQLYTEFRSADPLAPLAIEGLMLELLAHVGRGRLGPTESRAPRWLRSATELLNDRFTETVPIDEVAAVAGVHPAHLARAFRQYHRCTIGEYVRALRMDRAREMLANPSASLSGIALAVGYSDQSHFTTAFRRATGTTPGRYRRRLGTA